MKPSNPPSPALPNGTTTLNWTATRGRITASNPPPTSSMGHRALLPAISYLTTGSWTDPDPKAPLNFTA